MYNEKKPIDWEKSLPAITAAFTIFLLITTLSQEYRIHKLEQFNQNIQGGSYLIYAGPINKTSTFPSPDEKHKCQISTDCNKAYGYTQIPNN